MSSRQVPSLSCPLSSASLVSPGLLNLSPCLIIAHCKISLQNPRQSYWIFISKVNTRNRESIFHLYIVNDNTIIPPEQPLPPPPHTNIIPHITTRIFLPSFVSRLRITDISPRKHSPETANSFIRQEARIFFMNMSYHKGAKGLYLTHTFPLKLILNCWDEG